MVSEWFFECYFGFVVPFSVIERYFKLPLRVRLGLYIHSECDTRTVLNTTELNTKTQFMIC